MFVTFNANFKQFDQRLKNYDYKTIANSSINEGLFLTQAIVKTKELPGQLHLRNTFTQSSFVVDKAVNGVGRIGFTERAWFMEKLDHSTVRTPLKARYKRVPVGSKNGVVGSLRRFQNKASKNGHFFLKLKNGNIGEFKRIAKGKRGLMLIATLTKQTHYDHAYFPFESNITNALKTIDFESIMIKNFILAGKR